MWSWRKYIWIILIFDIYDKIKFICIEFLKKYTTPDNHFYVYDPIDETINDAMEYKANNILYMSFDSLPCELSLDSSKKIKKILS